MTIIHLIRHGETDWNLQQRWQGHADIPLNDVGRQQAQIAAQQLAAALRNVCALYASDLLRAVATAQPLAARLGLTPLLRPALREIDLGTWSGKTHAEIAAAFPADVAALAAGHDIRRGGAESVAMLRARIITELAGLAALHPAAEIAVVTHGGCIRMAIVHASGSDSVQLSHNVHIGNTSLTTLQLDDAGWSVLRVNDMTHLTALHDASLVSAPADDAEPAL